MKKDIAIILIVILILLIGVVWIYATTSGERPKNETWKEWKIHVNKEDGFSISYPAGYHISFGNNLVNYDENKSEVAMPRMGVRIQIQRISAPASGYDLTTEEGVQAFVKTKNEERDDVRSSELTPYRLGSITYKQEEFSGPGGIFYIYYVFPRAVSSYYTLLVWGAENDQEAVRKILESFSVQPQEEISKLKTYMHSVLGFKFEYPRTWGNFITSEFGGAIQEVYILLPSREGKIIIMGSDEYFRGEVFINSHGVEFFNSSSSGAGGFEWTYAFKNTREKGVVIKLSTPEDPSGKELDPEFKRDAFAWLGARIPEFNDMRKMIDSIELAP